MEFPKRISNMESDYLQSLGLEPGKYIIAVGRITPEKGFDYLIKAYKEAELKEYKLVIAGGVESESSYGEELQQLSKGTNVQFAGLVLGNDLVQLYKNARLYVLSSINEGFPLVLLEAMSYGLDVLVSDIPATHLVKLEREDYFEKANVKDLASKLKGKICNPSINRHYDLDEFDWDKIAAKVNEIYHSLF